MDGYGRKEALQMITFDETQLIATMRRNGWTYAEITEQTGANTHKIARITEGVRINRHILVRYHPDTQALEKRCRSAVGREVFYQIIDNKNLVGNIDMCVKGKNEILAREYAAKAIQIFKEHGVIQNDADVDVIFYQSSNGGRYDMFIEERDIVE